MLIGDWGGEGDGREVSVAAWGAQVRRKLSPLKQADYFQPSPGGGR